MRSLTTPEAIEELLLEMQNIKWDVVLISETWRDETNDLWETKQGHLFMGSPRKNKLHSGVAILLHRRIAKKKICNNWNPVDDRICTVDICTHGTKVRFISVCFPDCNNNDIEVEKVYANLEPILKNVKKSKKTVLLAGTLMQRLELEKIQTARTLSGNMGR